MGEATPPACSILTATAAVEAMSTGLEIECCKTLTVDCLQNASGGTVEIGSGAFTVTTNSVTADGSANGTVISPYTATLNIAAILQSASGTGSLIKEGNGVLQLRDRDAVASHQIGIGLDLGRGCHVALV